MAKKTDSSVAEDKQTEGGEGYGELNSDFNLEEEYKEDPLVTKGNYNGAVESVRMDEEETLVTWNIILNNNDPGLLCTDGETPVNGRPIPFKNWLPLAGDDRVMAKKGGTKRQVKINMLKAFSDQMQVSMNTMVQIREAIAEQEWVGIDVIVSVIIEKLDDGRHLNNISKMVRIPF